MNGLEMLGCRSGAQWLSFGGLWLPRRGDFVALVGNRNSKPLLDRVRESMGETDSVRVRSVTLPTHFPGAWSSDYWSFRINSYPAVMVTDTGPLRYPHYHTPEDTPDKLDVGWITGIVGSLRQAILSELGESSVCTTV